MPCYTPLGDHTDQLALKLKLFLDEVAGKGLHPRFEDLPYYSLGIDRRDIDKDTRTLCEWCKAHPHEVKKMSLELQIWCGETIRLRMQGGRDEHRVVLCHRLVRGSCCARSLPYRLG